MKILFVGYRNPHFLTLCEYIERAIDALGHERMSFDYRSWLIPGRIREAVEPLNHWDRNRINVDLLNKAKVFRPDLVLVTGGWTITQETITSIKQQTQAVTVNWIADFPLLFDTYLTVGPCYDYFFASGTDALKRYQNAGHRNGHWLPFACDEEIHTHVELSEEEMKKYKCDISFVGSYYSERVSILEKMVDFDLGIWGPGWDKLPQDSLLREKVRGGSLPPEEWVKIYAASNIGLNIIGHRNDVTVPFVEEKEFRIANTKVFEILGCQAFQLVDDKADVTTLFKNHQHLCVYKDGHDCAQLAQRYLSDEEKRKSIAVLGQREVYAKHTYQQRIKEILSIIESDRGK